MLNKTYIIAEAGVNHNGKMDLAMKLIHEAKRAGADCVKFQTFKTEEIVTENAPKANYQLEVTDKKESQFEMLKKLELSKDKFAILKEACSKIGIDFMSTPYSMQDLNLLDSLGVNSFKIASGQLTELGFLEEVAKKGKQIILSTGMGTLAEVYQAISAIRKFNENLIVLQCTTNYPSMIEESNIKAMVSIREACKVRVGYSDHVINNYACFSAVALGAEIIEKHFTLDKSMQGPDHSCSLNPEEFKDLVTGIRNIELSLGDGIKQPSANEIKNIYGMRRGLVVNQNIQKGDIITESIIGVKRPLSGIEPRNINLVLNKKVNKDMIKDQSITFNDILWEEL